MVREAVGKSWRETVAVMRIEWQIGFWIGAFLLLILMLWLFSGVLLPFAAAFALGYLLNPVVDRLERLGFNRLGATLLIMACFALVFALILVLLGPVLWRQLVSFTEALPAYAVKLEALISAETARLARDFGGGLIEKLGLGDNGGGELATATNDLVSQAAQWAASFLNSLLTSGAALLSLISLLVVTPVVFFYMLLDWHKMIATIDGLVPLRHRETVRALAGEINTAMEGFLRGQALVGLFLGAWYGIGFSLIGLNFGLLIGITAGISELHSLCRLIDRLSLFLDGRNCAGLAAMEVTRHVAWRIFGWSIPRRQYFVAEARRRIGWTAPGVADFRAACIRQPVWFHRPHYRGSVCRRRRSDLAFRGQALPRKQSLFEHGWFRPSDFSRIQHAASRYRGPSRWPLKNHAKRDPRTLN